MIQITFSNFPKAVVCYPLDFARTQLSADTKEHPDYNGIVDCWRVTVRVLNELIMYDIKSVIRVCNASESKATWLHGPLLGNRDLYLR